MEHPRKLRTFAEEKSNVGVSAAFFTDVSQQSKTKHGSGGTRRSMPNYIIVKCKLAKKLLLFMYLKSKINVQAGSRESHEPRLIGEVVKDLLMNSNEPLAVAYRKRHQTDTHLNVDNSQQLAFEKRRVQ